MVRRGTVTAEHCRETLIDFLLWFVIAVFAGGFLQQSKERVLELGQVDAVLWTLGPCYTGPHLRQVKFQHGAVGALTFARDAKQSLRLKIVAEGFDLFVCP